MVRDTGFEPVTPTVSKLGATILPISEMDATLTRYRSSVQSRYRAPKSSKIIVKVSAAEVDTKSLVYDERMQSVEQLSVNGGITEVVGLPVVAATGFRCPAQVYFDFGGGNATFRGKKVGKSTSELSDVAFAISC